ETINAIHDKPALSSLPDEAQALADGNSPAFNQFAPAGFEQKFLGPRDTPSKITDSLLSAFSPRRLKGEAPPLPASYAMIPSAVVEHFPHFDGQGCQAIGMTPVPPPQGVSDAPPTVNGHAFNPLPSTLPGHN